MVGIKFGGEKEWNHCWENYQETQVSSEKLIMLEALGASTDSWLLQRYLLRSLDRDMVKSQDMETVIISVASNSDGQFLVWRHLKAYWPQIHVLLGNGSLSGLISVVVSNFFTEYDYHEVRTFYILSYFLIYKYSIFWLTFFVEKKLRNFTSKPKVFILLIPGEFAFDSIEKENFQFFSSLNRRFRNSLKRWMSGAVNEHWNKAWKRSSSIFIGWKRMRISSIDGWWIIRTLRRVNPLLTGDGRGTMRDHHPFVS